MPLAARPWLLAVLFAVLVFLPSLAHAGMTDAEVKEFMQDKELAEKGDRVAQFNMGINYANGLGVAKDLVQAVFWYRKAADQGYVQAQNNLGYYYAKGLGLPKDFVQAVTWYRMAADQGYAQAQFNLGIRFEKGEGVAKDFVQAVFWYRKAAEQGDAEAQFNLGYSYDNGEGVPKDEIEAYAYYNLAGITHQSARKNLAILEKKMSRDEIASGQQRTKQLQKEIEAKQAGK